MLTIGSLFSGIGGLELGLESLGLGPVLWQAESDPFCRAVLTRHYPSARRYKRVEEIDEDAPKVRILGGGFPCQDISIAGGRAGIDGPRSCLWFEFVRIIRVLGPDIVFVENVPELAAYLGRVLGPLAELGFDAEWGVFSAAEVGAPHLRERMFILAYTPGFRFGHRQCGEGDALARLAGGPRPQHTTAPRSCNALGDAQGQRRGAAGLDARQGGEQPALDRTGWWEAEPDVGRVVDGPSSRLDARQRRASLRALGNGCVPQQVAHAFVTLTQRAGLLGGA